ncbi:hypothetical protein WMY93_012036 [Mugilogobius chulae]|uniref:Uncharacterized protein n=1 Tax=Mugilogobius chulae TaxID=88201 RepID=A0AAW0P5K9_9GOBI
MGMAKAKQGTVVSSTAATAAAAATASAAAASAGPSARPAAEAATAAAKAAARAAELVAEGLAPLEMAVEAARVHLMQPKRCECCYKSGRHLTSFPIATSSRKSSHSL